MKRKNYAGIDFFRFFAALLVIAIHTAPLSFWNNDLDFLLTYCFGRIAVPFFLMTTGYFVLAPHVLNGFGKKETMHHYLIKNTGLYLAATAFYFPLMLYSHNLPHSIAEFLKSLLFDGTFYHLWYFPAAVIGCNLILFFAARSMKSAVIFSAAAYITGLLGDSCYGLVKDLPIISDLYDGIFQISSYTRNGIFFTPVFLLLGVFIAIPGLCCSKKACIRGICISLPLLFLEGFLTYSAKLQKHNSMYFFLLPVMYFLFQLLLTIPGKAPAWLRNCSMLIYIIHPAVIVLLRGIAKTANLTSLLVDNTLMHYFCVCLLSVAIVTGIRFLLERRSVYVSKRTRLD